MKAKSETNGKPCELKSEFCDGQDVRLVQRIWREGGRSMRGGTFHWCKGCRDYMNGGFRYPR